MNATHPLTTPHLVNWLGYGGLVPFVFFAVATCVAPGYLVFYERALLTYGAVILSFVGALHWGFAMTLQRLSTTQRQQAYAWSVVPALLAWLALLLEPATWASFLVVAGFLGNYWRDVCLARLATLPNWYLPLRLRLTAVACVCLLALPAATVL